MKVFPIVFISIFIYLETIEGVHRVIRLGGYSWISDNGGPYIRMSRSDRGPYIRMSRNNDGPYVRMSRGVQGKESLRQYPGFFSHSGITGFDRTRYDLNPRRYAFTIKDEGFVGPKGSSNYPFYRFARKDYPLDRMRPIIFGANIHKKRANYVRLTRGRKT